MDDRVELLTEILGQVPNLAFEDENELDSIRRRLEMLIGKIFGVNSKYIEDLDHIHFYPMIAPATDEYARESWEAGKHRLHNLIQVMMEDLELTFVEERSKDMQSDKDVGVSSNKIFIVHGQDDGMKVDVARTIEHLDLNPVILHEQASKGLTIIEKFTEYSDVSFAVVLLSPDDFAYPRNDNPEKASLRARQNVVFELGFFIGALGRQHVAVLYKKDPKFEMPSDYSGVIYIPYDSSGKWKFKLVKEFHSSGFKVDANKIL